VILGGWAFSYERGTPVDHPRLSCTPMHTNEDAPHGGVQGYKIAPHKALNIIARGKLIFDEGSYSTVWYRGASLSRTTLPVGPYSSPLPRDLWWS